MSVRAWTELARPAHRSLAALPLRRRCQLATLMPAGGLAVLLLAVTLGDTRDALRGQLALRLEAATRTWHMAEPAGGDAARLARELTAGLGATQAVAEARVVDGAGLLLTRAGARETTLPARLARGLGMTPDALTATLARSRGAAWRLILVPSGEAAGAVLLRQAALPLSAAGVLLALAAMLAGRLARRLEGGLDRIALDLRDTVEEVLSLLAPAAYGKGLELVHLVYADVPVKLYGDPLRIRQVLTNLVHNAIKFTPAGRIVVRVMLDDDTHEPVRLRITVTDTGIGLSARDQERLFRGFSQADTTLTRRFGGTGLGLIISRKLLEQMGGEVGLESREGEGSTFWFTLSLTPVGAMEADADRVSPLAGRQVLLLDEEPLSRLALRHLLEGWDMQVTEADERSSFLSLATASRRWHLLAVGVSRRQLGDGLARTLLPRLQEQPAPVLVMASTVDRSELRVLRQQGAAAALPRAVRRQTLYRELCRLHGQPGGAPAPLATAPAPRDSQTAPRVLVVDDHAVNRKLVTTIARRLGAGVVEAADGPEAVSACRREAFDVVFMDIQMPGMSGEAAAAEVRRRAPEASPVIVALTANALHGERERLLAAGMDGCLTKPVTTADVAALLLRPDDPAAAPHRAALQRALRAELPLHRRAIREAYRGNDAGRLGEVCHRLHGAASSCHLPALAAACEQVEQAVRADDRVTIPAAVAALQAAISACEEPDPAGSRTP